MLSSYSGFFCVMFLLGGGADRVMQSLCAILFIYQKRVPGLLVPPPPPEKKRQEVVALLRNPNVPETHRFIFFPKSVFCISGFFLAFSLTPLLPELQKSNRNPFIPCSLAALSHCCNDQCLWQELQLSQFPLPPGTFCVPSI